MNSTRIYNKTNWRILEIIKNETLNLRDMAKRLNKSPATIHNNLKSLREFDIVKIKKEKNQYMISPNTESFYYKSFMQLINYERIKNCKSLKELERIGLVGIYGSFATGSDDKNSDLDLFVFTERNEMQIREIVNKLSKEMNREISLLMLNKRKLEELKKKDYEFYIRLRLESTMFNGDIFA